MPIARGKSAQHRLGGRNNFARVFDARHSAGNSFLVVYAAANELPMTRMGLSVGRKHGNAVRRNRIKRLLRAAFRAEYDNVPVGFDLICIPKTGRPVSLEEFSRSLRSVVSRAVQRAVSSEKGRA